MATFVMGLFVVQLVVGVYQLGYVLARRNRLPDPAVVFHPLLGIAAVGLWVVYQLDEQNGAAWGSFVCVVLGVVLGAVMSLRTLRIARQPARTGDEALMAERTIPLPVLGLHGLGGLVLLVCTFLVASGVT